MRPLLLALLLGVGAAVPSATSQDNPTTLALRGLDPVALVAGQEVEGRANLTAERGRYRYRFANADNRAAFAAEPARFAIQLGGGCGRMGPLSGVGDPARFAVHAGRIYIFSSESCRDGFLADPRKHLDRPDPVPEGDTAAAARAGHWLDEAVDAVGGAEKLDGLWTLVLIRDEAQEHDGQKHRTGAAVFVRFKGSIRTESWWGDWHRIDVVAENALGGDAFVHERTAEGVGTWDLDAAQKLAMHKAWQRHPIAILRARDRDDFVAFYRGSDEVGGRDVELVETAWGGATATLGVDRKDGRIRSVSYHGRAGSTPLGDVTVTYDDFLEVSDLTLPTTSRVTFDGRERAPRTWTTVAVDQPLDAAWFDRASISAERSVKPGINAQFLAKDLDVARFVRRFEGESREIFVSRHRIAKAIGVEPGDAVADIGAGTGLFLQLFADAVGEGGKLYAVDIAPKFIEHLDKKVADKRLDQVETVLCTERSCELPDSSIDIAFICDVYHHFEYPAQTMESIRRAMRPGGTLVVVDFERIPGESREFILNHVRAGKEVFRAEIEEAGFEFVDEIEVKGLRENYVMRFRAR